MKKNVILYVMSGILLAAYLCILVMSLDVSATTDAYRMYYITGELRYFATDEEFSEYGWGIHMNISFREITKIWEKAGEMWEKTEPG